MLNQPVTSLKGVGAARAALFEKLGLTTVRDVLYFAPREYQDYSRITPVCELVHGQLAAVEVALTSEPRLAYPRGGMQIVSATGMDATGKVQVTWFNQPYRKNQIHADETYIFCGRVDRTRGVKLVNPAVMPELPGLMPVYPLVQGLSQRQLRLAVEAALAKAEGSLKETLPRAFRLEHGLCELNYALENLHNPLNYNALELARRRLSFEDVLQYTLAVAMLQKDRAQKAGITFETAGMQEKMEAKLPFKPTQGQRKVMEEIAKDMQKPVQMNRLVQGDVGSGKTVLALYAMLVAMENGWQSAMMVPTEILAQQHYQTMCGIFGEDCCCLLKGGMRKKEREAALLQVASGQAKVIIGTHALLQEGVEFLKLGLVVTDEQHRFGVCQRAKIADKARRAKENENELVPDVLIMSATPIPRTLSLILYGDLDISILNERPPGRQPVRTQLVPEHKRVDMYGFVKKQALAGRQTYVVCPLVEQSDALDVKSAQELHEELEKLLPELSVGLLHGRMAAAKKEETIEAFRKGELQVLVSTTVVEVGVDVPNAAIMVIENAERFGLAQLHQLRGRVGRGAEQSYCFLLSKDSMTVERLEVLTKTEDGFKIAQKDLELRGPGEFMGTRQHGMDEFSAMRMATNVDVLHAAQKAAQQIAAMGKAAPGFEGIIERAEKVYREKMQSIAAN